MSNVREIETRKGGEKDNYIFFLVTPPNTQINDKKLALIDNKLNEVKFPKLRMFCPCQC